MAGRASDHKTFARTNMASEDWPETSTPYKVGKDVDKEEEEVYPQGNENGALFFFPSFLPTSVAQTVTCCLHSPTDVGSKPHSDEFRMNYLVRTWFRSHIELLVQYSIVLQA